MKAVFFLSDLKRFGWFRKCIRVLNSGLSMSDDGDGVGVDEYLFVFLIKYSSILLSLITPFHIPLSSCECFGPPYYT